MLHIFSKKHFLKDLLEDFVDIHNHILPGIDDGAKTVDASIELIKNLHELGVKQFIATPHIMQDYYPNTEESIGNAYELIMGNLNMYLFNNITVHSAAEYMLDTHFEHLLNEGHLLTLKRNYVLVELSYLQPPIHLEDIILKIVLKGYIPVLAHPERYHYFHKKLNYYNHLKNLGCKFQLNLLSLSDHYGKSVQKTARYLLHENLVDYTGTDAHNLYQVDNLSKLILSKKEANKMVLVIQNTNNTFSVL